jgi:hypothetical protein
LNIEQNNVGSLGDVLLNYLDTETLKLANNQLKKLPIFKINIETNCTMSLNELSLETIYSATLSSF